MFTPEQINPFYAALLIIGGIIGYVKAGSTPSLISGAGCGVLVAAFTFLDLPLRALGVTGKFLAEVCDAVNQMVD
ncbi:unnamed protein product [Strongylus vulgaris]|uniref:Uncharacterized protein n=1 Tax=Strongylus vulgaris TaxID=40348 RepID=A0A3P7LJY7_STRVU|nr:unnamed protein product [Strongylus vulgaris]